MNWNSREWIVFWAVIALAHGVDSYRAETRLDEIYNALVCFVSACIARIEFRLNKLDKNTKEV